MPADCPYQIRETDVGCFVVRPVTGGGFLTIAGPFNTRYEAEVAALKRWHGGASRKAA